ncbi:hypothetical protein BDY19DRAFT_895620 [Irpex rosettiformis]|uniref:Uncharacterized protein n=1 Tax=Irpex rosettiformis TaxID=378272 RepID=A0ACB8TV93_9APHY|nr:hypothetical protein BDY19DRAFT_895620 [Irpex rosettiformis]
MYVFKSLVAFLAVGLVAALPHGSHGTHSDIFNHHVRARALRRTCKPGQVNNGTEAATPSPAIAQTFAASPSSSVAHTSSSHSASQTHTTSSSADAAAKTPSSINVHGSLAALAPLGFENGWSTSSSAPNALSLSDSTFRPHDKISALPWNYKNAPDGKLSLVAHYPQGSWNFQGSPLGGLSAYLSGPSGFDFSKAKEVVFGYSLLFEDGFDFNLGGKLFGLYGGDDGEGATSCSGGSRNDACFSVRTMFRPDGAGEIYTYLPPSFSANDRVCNVAPKSDCNPTYGASVGRGAFTFTPGNRNNIAIRVLLNDAGKENGEIELFADGKSVISVDGLVLRQSGKGIFGGIMAQTFFGGSNNQWASPKSQNSYFSDFTVSVTKTL